MNIQKILHTNYIYAVNYNNECTKNKPILYNLKLSEPIKCDTVCFKSKAKKVLSPELRAAMARKKARLIRDAKLLEEAKTEQTKKDLSGDERSWGVSLSTAQKIHDMVEKPQEQIHNFLHRFFGDLLVTECEPNNLLLEIADRPKSALSIMEKSASLKLNSVDEIMAPTGETDLNGGKFIMNYKTGQPDVEQTLGRLIPLIKTEKPVVRLHEMEVHRPKAIEGLSDKEQEEFDYASKAFLDKLEDIQEEVINGLETDPEKIILINRPLPKYSKGNYCALHLLMQLNEKDSRPFELQIMGPYVGTHKPFDDLGYKFFHGKRVEPKYNRLIKIWNELMTDENKDAKERFLQYCRDSFFDLRLREKKEYETKQKTKKGIKLFKSHEEYKLMKEYNLNYQVELKRSCDSNAETAAKNLEKSRVQQEVMRRKTENLIKHSNIIRFSRNTSHTSNNNKPKKVRNK